MPTFSVNCYCNEEAYFRYFDGVLKMYVVTRISKRIKHIDNYEY